jgi:hypothetical protein
MANGMDSKYLKELEQVLEAEAALAREGVDLLADPEYRALRELFIDGDMPIDEFVTRVEGLAAVRPEITGTTTTTKMVTREMRTRMRISRTSRILKSCRCSGTSGNRTDRRTLRPAAEKRNADRLDI